ncbi:MAG: sulfatase-like hydrolase/transferase [Elusimicrobiales bacterium]|nr:sulfatase-like hydrolase/transferase [Elusimicrobiales bacterium]
MAITNKKTNIIFPFLILNIALSLLIGIPYFGGISSNAQEIFFVFIAYISNTFMIHAVLALLTFPFFLFKRGRYFYIPIYILVQMTLIIDVAIYKIFKFHINPMVMNILTSKAGFATLEQGLGMQIFAGFLLLVVVGFEIWFMRLSSKENKFINKKRKIIAVTALFLFVLADKGMYAYGDLKDNVFITRNHKVFPLYQPLTIKHFAIKYLGVKVDKKVKVKLSKKNSRLDYPKNKITFNGKPNKRPNIIFLVGEAVRYDMMTADIMPNTYDLAKKSLVFKNHYSGGNCTRFGIFSLFYGLYGSYWFNVLGERRSPVMMDVLQELDYRFKIYAAVKLSFPEFNKTCFVNVPREDIYDEPKAKDKVGRDTEIANEFRKFLSERDGKKPYFAFLFFDASHGNYSYPKEMEKFKPAAHSFNYLTFNKKKVLPVFNKFKNSIHFFDSLVGDIVEDIKKRGELENTIIVVTGDHGEPFFEKGYHGHNQAYSEEEIKVSMVVRAPGKKHKVYSNFTSHLDLPATILNLLNVKNPVKDYSNGANMLIENKRDFVSAFSWDSAAIIKDDITIVAPLSAQRFSGVKVMDKNTYKEIEDKKVLEDNLDTVWKFQKEAQKFYK